MKTSGKAIKTPRANAAAKAAPDADRYFALVGGSLSVLCAMMRSRNGPTR